VTGAENGKWVNIYTINAWGSLTIKPPAAGFVSA